MSVSSFISPTISALGALIGIIFFPRQLQAQELNVTFTESLTNQTKWAYTSNVKFYNNTELCISSSKGDTAITSPLFDFAITSLTVSARFASDKTSRQLWVTPILNGVKLEELKQEISPQKAADYDTISCSWPNVERVQSITFNITGSHGNVYLINAKILGEKIPKPPSFLRAEKVEGMRINLAWENQDQSTQNKVYIYESTQVDESFEPIYSYTFNEYTNTNKKIKTPESFEISYPKFLGSTFIYLPINSNGQIQISNADKKGVLVHKGFDDCANTYIDITAKKYSDSDEEDLDTMTIGYEESYGITNIIATIILTKNFNREIIPLKDVPQNTPILFNTTGRQAKHRIIIDNLAFTKNYIPEGEKLKLAQSPQYTKKPELTLLNLSRETDYLIKVTSLNNSNLESDPSELRVKTTSKNSLGFKVRIR